jgi:predicted NAD-dependent protein-ADP-ribosyltransferase YbiA (DUF1768 family)
VLGSFSPGQVVQYANIAIGRGDLRVIIRAKFHPGDDGEAYPWLLNSYPITIDYEGTSYPSVEHAFIASRTYDMFLRKGVARCPINSLRLYEKQLTARDGWKDAKVGIMWSLALQKFTRDRVLRMRLLATGDNYIEYGRHNFWGAGKNGYGANVMGKILMAVRAELRDPNIRAQFRAKWQREAEYRAESRLRIEKARKEHGASPDVPTGMKPPVCIAATPKVAWDADEDNEFGGDEV